MLARPDQQTYCHPTERRCCHAPILLYVRSGQDLRADELVLLTKKPPPAAVRSLKTPPVHVIALLERSERAAGRTELGAVVNILSGDEHALL